MYNFDKLKDNQNFEFLFSLFKFCYDNINIKLIYTTRLLKTFS